MFSRCNKYFILLQFSILTGYLNCFSQDYSYINYDTRDGLAGSVVYDALQDKEGFIWFATENGLSRFDGTNFKTFTTKEGLPDNEISKLFLDSGGRLWIMSFAPSLCYYHKGKIYTKTNDSLLAKVTLSAHAFDMAEDKSGNLFVIEIRALHSLLQDGTIKTINWINNQNTSVRGIGANMKGEVDLLISELSASKEQVHYLFNPLTQRKRMIKKNPFASDISLLVGPEYIVLPNDNSHLSFYKDSSEFFSVKIPENTVSISNIDNKRISVNTRAGIQIFDTQTKSFLNIPLKHFSITSVYQDKENNLWLTTMGSGILMIPSFQFRNYTFSANNSVIEIAALCKIENTVYAAGLGKKIWKVNSNDLSFSSFITDVAVPQNSKSISLLPFNNKLILGNTQYYQNPFNPQKKGVLSVKSVSIGKSGVIFASHIYSVLCKWSGEEEIIWRERSTSAVEKDSGFYIGTLNGLYHKSYSNDTIYLGSEFPPFKSRIVNLAVSEKGILWVTTKGNGIAAYARNKMIYRLTENDGLSSDNCTSLYLDGDVIWLGTDKGLNRIEISGTRKEIVRFSMSDGLPSEIINAIVTAGNKVFVGTPKGLTYFDTDKISQTSASDLQLTGIYIADKYWTYDSTDFSLLHKDNDIRFEYSGISFKSAGEMTYRYRLLGLHTDWKTTQQKQLSFQALSSGKYLLQLKAINKYGVESRIKEVSFTIQKLLLEKIWVRLIILSLLVGGIWLFFRHRIRKVRQKEQEQSKLDQRIAELEQKALRSQMNPHFIFNSLNSIQQYVADRDITGANNFITDFSQLIRMTLDLSTHAFISMPDEIKYIDTFLRLEKTRLENQFDYSITIDENLDLHEIYLPPLLVQPYVENSIRHGIKYKTEGKGLIQVSVEKNDPGVLIRIEDNGVGREASKNFKSKFHIQYQSKGMSINKDRIDILNNYNDKKIEILILDLYNEKREATGTRVDIYLAE